MPLMLLNFILIKYISFNCLFSNPFNKIKHNAEEIFDYSLQIHVVTRQYHYPSHQLQLTKK